MPRSVQPSRKGYRVQVDGFVAISLISIGLLVWSSVEAAEFEVGEVSGSFDTTVTAGLSFRVADRDPRLIGIANGGTRRSVNGDNGNLNYDRGPTSAVGRVTHELAVDYQNYGAFVRATYFYDIENKLDDRERTPLSSDAERQVGADFDLLDAYVFGDFDVADRPLDVRFGNQVLSWGESTFIPNGINTINPVDVGALRLPGSEVRDALQPVPMISASAALTDNLSVEGFYQFLWRETEVDAPGTYFSTNDFVGDGGDELFLGFGAARDTAPFVPGTRVRRSETRDAGDLGDFGLALRYFAPELNDTEFGLYYINYNSRLPLISARTGSAASLAGGLPGYVNSASYFIEYPENINLFGASFNTQLPTGTSLQGEYSFRKDQPFQVDDVELLFAALSPVNAALGINQLGPQSFSSEISGFRELDMSQAQVTAIHSFGPSFGADQLVVIGEVGATYVHGMPSKSELRFDGPGTDTSGNPAFTAGGAQPVTTTDGFADPFSWGYRLVGRLTYNNAIGAVNLSPLVAFQHDVNGTTPLPIGNFVEDRKAVTIGVEATYLNSWSANLQYTNFFGAGGNNLINDRDFVAVSVKYSF
ncbi:MAG: DUF1302 domain-containing protein [Inquilinaceae bacterium]